MIANGQMKKKGSTMDDLIKRQDAMIAHCEYECGKGMTRENCGSIACGTIFDDIPPAQQWIQCSERLPEKTGWYAVKVASSDDLRMVFGYESITSDKFDAWMELPTP